MAADLASLIEGHRGLREGRAADYIPALAQADPEVFAIAACAVDGREAAAGDADLPFTIQSISKPFVYGLALDLLGRSTLREKVGVEPTGEAFNSIVELEEGVHRPYNPMINSGAIAVTALLQAHLGPQARERIEQLFSSYLGRPATVDEQVLASEVATGDRNRAIGYLLRHFGVLRGELEDVLALYATQCAMLASTRELARMAATLANGGIQPFTREKALEPGHVRDVLSLMLTCGLYDTSGEWAYSVGLPAKSGVSGGILAVVPGRMGLAVYSPRLDEHGHSVRGMAVFRNWSQAWGLGLFGR
ncbi:MAG TPA: glutaminase A [Ramlibacter sp.]|nr:glutaminase A [Ramlibacter sp.]